MLHDLGANLVDLFLDLLDRPVHIRPVESDTSGPILQTERTVQ